MATGRSKSQVLCAALRSCVVSDQYSLTAVKQAWREHRMLNNETVVATFNRPIKTNP